MYDEHPARPFSWPEIDPYDSSYRAFDPGRDRLTHLVMVDGRLVDVWSEPVTGTRWEQHADRFDRERRPPAPPSPPVHEQVLAWLDAAVGGRERLLALTSEPLPDTDFEPDPDLAGHDREALATAVDLLDHAARRLWVGEARSAQLAALRAAWESDRETVLALASASRLAGGVAWVVAKANGLLGTRGITTQAILQEATDCPTQLSVAGRAVRQLVSGYWPDPPRVPPMPDLLLTGRPDLLISTTRRRLVRARDQALSAQAIAAGQVVRSA